MSNPAVRASEIGASSAWASARCPWHGTDARGAWRRTAPAMAPAGDGSRPRVWLGAVYGAEDLATGHPLASQDPDGPIFVGHLAFTTTEQDLRQLFEPYGTVETVRMMTGRETGRSCGFGVVEMPDSRAAHSAIDALNGTYLAGRALTVNAARPREPRQPRW